MFTPNETLRHSYFRRPGSFLCVTTRALMCGRTLGRRMLMAWSNARDWARCVGMRKQEDPPSTFISIEQNDYMLLALLAVPRIAVGPKNVFLPFKIAAGYIVEKKLRLSAAPAGRKQAPLDALLALPQPGKVLIQSASHATCTRAKLTADSRKPWSITSAMTCQNASFPATPVPSAFSLPSPLATS